MILDDNLISIDGKELGSEAITGEAIALTSFQKPGRMGPIPMYTAVTGEAAGGTSITFKLQQADDKDGAFADVPGSEVAVQLADMEAGKNLAWRFLPMGVTKPWIKVVATPEGEFSGGKLTAAVVREEVLPYEKGMYIDGGVVEG